MFYNKGLQNLNIHRVVRGGTTSDYIRPQPIPD